MKKILITSLVLFVFPLTLYAVATLRTSTGFYYPTDKKYEDSTYIGYGDRNSFFGNRCHLANDYDFPEGSSVYAVGAGVVDFDSTNIPFYGGADGTPGGVLIIKHSKADDTFFYALYGHIKNFSVEAGDTVVGGQKIAEVAAFSAGGNSQPHLHFGINPGSSSFLGYTLTDQCSDFLGFVDPEVYLVSNSPKINPDDTATDIGSGDETGNSTDSSTSASNDGSGGGNFGFMMLGISLLLLTRRISRTRYQKASI